MKGELNISKQATSRNIVTATGCAIWIFLAVWGSITNQEQCISAAGHSLLLLIALVFGVSKQIKNLIEYVKSWI